MFLDIRNWYICRIIETTTSGEFTQKVYYKRELMRKKLHTNLLDLANDILKLEEDTDISILQNFAKEVYEHATLLKFLEKEYKENTMDLLGSQTTHSNKNNQSQKETTPSQLQNSETLDDILEGYIEEPIFIKREYAKKKLEEISNSKKTEAFIKTKLKFIESLFDNSIEDYLRVISQIQTIGNFEKIKIFIEEVVKPDYNHWKDVEEYEKQFLEAIKNGLI